MECKDEKTNMECKDEKTNRILSCNKIKPAPDGRCGFFVRRKQRYCKMLPAKGNKFCAEHLCEDTQQVYYILFRFRSKLIIFTI